MSNATGRRINVHDATIKTATVEVKALTISGKQVTACSVAHVIPPSVDYGTTGHYYWQPCGI